MIYVRVQMKTGFSKARRAILIRRFIAYRIKASAMQAVGLHDLPSWGFLPSYEVFEMPREVFYIAIDEVDDYHEEIGYFLSRSMRYASIKNIYVQKSEHINRDFMGFNEFWIEKKIRHIEFNLVERDGSFYPKRRYSNYFLRVGFSGDSRDYCFERRRK